MRCWCSSRSADGACVVWVRRLDAVLRVDDQRRIVAANAAAVALTGFAVDRLVGKSCPALLDPRGRNGKSVWDNGWHRSALLRSTKQLPEQEITISRANGTDV